MATALAGTTNTLTAKRRPLLGYLFLAALVVGLSLVAYHARTGAVAARIRNPAVHGAPRPIAPLWGFHHWLLLEQVGLIPVMLGLLVACIVGWRRRPGHPVVLMVIVTTTLVWQDPIMNWAPYAVYNPQLWHWPETWGLVSIAPTVEPFLVIGYATFYMLPFFPALWLFRRIQVRRPLGTFVWRHPLITLSLMMLVIGMVFDAMLEIFCVNTQLYIYSQVVPFGSVNAGHWNQFPLIWETVLVTLVMIPAGLLLYRDDTGRTHAEKLAKRLPILASRPTLATFAVMAAIINVAYFAYGASYAILRDGRLATSVACPYPFPEAKVYDPQGFYERAGQPGPYFSGNWSGWESAQPDGRPTVTKPADGGRCGHG